VVRSDIDIWPWPLTLRRLRAALCEHILHWTVAQVTSRDYMSAKSTSVMTSPLTSRAPTDDMVSASAAPVINRASSAEMGEDRAGVVQPTAISGAVSAVWRNRNVSSLTSSSSPSSLRLLYTVFAKKDRNDPAWPVLFSVAVWVRPDQWWVFWTPSRKYSSHL